MKAVYDTIVAIRAASGKNAKRAILAAHRSNDDLREFLRVCYEPRINFYISKIDKRAPGVKQRAALFDRLFLDTLVARLAGRQLTGSAAHSWLNSLRQQFANDWERELLEIILDRDIKAGISTNSINSVWADLITDVPYMRCSLPKASKIKEFDWKAGVFSQIKADGMFANVTHAADGSISIMSRNGSPFPLDAFPVIAAWVEKNIPTNVQLHGELLVAVDRISGREILPRQIGNGMLNRLLKGGELPANHVAVYECWDAIPANRAVSGGVCNTAYRQRWAQMVSWFGACADAVTPVTMIESRLVHSKQEAMEHYRAALDRGLEGTVLKDGGAVWEDKTSKYQVKFKMEVSVELRVVGFKPGRNKFEGMVGSLECESQDGKLSVNVSGFPDDLRAEITANFEKDWKGGVVSVISNSLMPERNGVYSLFLPRFAERRLDKKKADTLEQIKAQFEAATAEL